MELESIIGDRGFESWLVNRVVGWLSERGSRLPEYVMCELQPVSGGVRFRLLEVAETEDGDYGVVGVFYEASFSERALEYLYREYLEERSTRLKPPRYESSPLQELLGPLGGGCWSWCVILVLDIPGAGPGLGVWCWSGGLGVVMGLWRGF